MVVFLKCGNVLLLKSGFDVLPKYLFRNDTLTILGTYQTTWSDLLKYPTNQSSLPMIWPLLQLAIRELRFDKIKNGVLLSKSSGFF